MYRSLGTSSELDLHQPSELCRLPRRRPFPRPDPPRHADLPAVTASLDATETRAVGLSRSAANSTSHTEEAEPAGPSGPRKDSCQEAAASKGSASRLIRMRTTPFVTSLREQCLLVGQRVLRNDLRRRVGNLPDQHSLGRNDGGPSPRPMRVPVPRADKRSCALRIIRLSIDSQRLIWMRRSRRR